MSPTDSMTADGASPRSSPDLLRISGLSKSFGGVHALRNVSLDVGAGEVHALCGENGAGKSTLIKILTGVVRPDAGRILFGGETLRVGDVHASESVGIAAMHQESTAFPDLNAVDNVFVGREITRCGGLFLNRAAMQRETQQLLDRLGERLDLGIPIGELPLAQRQMVSMARAMSGKCRLLIMDEPTASLSSRETEFMLRRVGQLREEGVSVLYVSHRLDEVFRIADRVTVLRDGQVVSTCTTSEIDKPRLIRQMVGREVAELTQRHEHRPAADQVALEVRGLGGSRFRDVSFAVRRGEIVGMTGLVGAGRTEVARAVFGIDSYQRGSVLIDGQVVRAGSVERAMSAGMAMVPEDRQHEGLVLPMTIGANVSLASLKRTCRLGVIRRSEERQLVDEQMTSLDVRAESAAAAANTLSGGNQQKVVIGKWLSTRPKVLILDEPTRGVDVAAKAQVHRIIRRLADQGLATLLISSDLPEVLSISDRVLVMREGSISGEFDGKTATQEELLRRALPDTRERV